MLNRIQVKEIKNDLSNSEFKFLSDILKKKIMSLYYPF